MVVYDSSCGVNWTIDDTLDGSAAGDEAGKAVDLSTDGSVLAVDYPGNNGNGYAMFFEDDSVLWSQINDIVGPSSGDEFDVYVSVSDSNKVTVGVEKNDFKRGLVGVCDAFTIHTTNASNLLFLKTLKT